MKKQQKQRFEYVDEFRKISTLQKLPTLADKLQNIFEDDVEKDNNNYMRFRKEPIIDRWDNPEHQQAILSNQCVEERVENLLNEEKDKYQLEDHRVRNHIRMFKEWSETNKDTKLKNQSFKFFYKNASPPKKISELDAYAKNDKNLKSKANADELRANQQKQISELDILNMGNQKSKYDFKVINQKRMDYFLDKPERQKNSQTQKEEDIFFLTFRKYQNFKTLEQISAIDEIKMMEEDFYYDLDNKDESNVNLDEYFLNKFIYKSVTKSLKNTEKDVQYFRDIGLPSRNLDKYTQTIGDIKKGKQLSEQDTKQQAHFLHLLRQSELNINKNQMSFDDISNISNGRITFLNAYMCIRSEKVTKAQFEKLLRKLDKYKKQQMQKGKAKQQFGMCTDDIDMEFTQEKTQVKEEKNSVSELINQIGQIRQSASLLRTTGANDGIRLKQVAFKKQKFTRLESLLKKLYEKIVTDTAKYPFTFLENHLDKIDDLLLEEYKDGKLLWFILDSYEQILKNLPDEDNIKTITKKKPINEPKVTHYKGSKLIKQEKIKVKNLYTYRDRTSPIQVPTNDRSKVKNKNNDRTPTKTEQKKPIYTNTYNFTQRRL